MIPSPKEYQGDFYYNNLIYFVPTLALNDFELIGARLIWSLKL